MKKYVGILLTGLLLWWACSDDSDNYIEIPGVASAEDFVDTRDGKTYRCVEIGDQIWMAENLAYRLPEGPLGGCSSWQEVYFDTTSVAISDAEFRDSLIAALASGEIDESSNIAEVNRQMAESGLAEGSFQWQLTYNDLMYWYTLSEYLDQTPSATYDKIMATFENDAFHFQNLYPAVVAFDTRIRAEKLEAYSMANLEQAEQSNDNYSGTYGFLYSFEAAQRAMPTEGGWRIPTDEDWKKLERHLGMSDGDINRDNEWRGTNQAAYLKADERGVGFNALYGGGKVYTPNFDEYYDNEDFINKGRNAYFWTSENIPETDSTRVGIIRSVAVWTDQILRTTTRFTNSDNHPTMYSVRLVKDK